ncbi:MAG: hypothetical protein IPJ82_19560 [Lewinellaceae bacterium]|nr:hypothetical protein [Lewinellaceae bacterium]
MDKVALPAWIRIQAELVCLGTYVGKTTGLAQIRNSLIGDYRRVKIKVDGSGIKNGVADLQPIATFDLVKNKAFGFGRVQFCGSKRIVFE